MLSRSALWYTVRMRKTILLALAVASSATLPCVATAPSPSQILAQDAMKTPRLRDVRLKGVPAVKMNDLFRERLTGDFAKLNVFAEARRAFVDRDDDCKGHGGVWRGEFWGKQMLSPARVADYLADPAFTKFVREECHRLMSTQDPDGYLGSYKDKELVSIVDPEQTRKTYGWYPVWNIWNRKYAMWGMLMAYKAKGDREILASVERQMKQLIGMLHRRYTREGRSLLRPQGKGRACRDHKNEEE